MVRPALAAVTSSDSGPTLAVVPSSDSRLTPAVVAGTSTQELERLGDEIAELAATSACGHLSSPGADP